MYAVIGWSFLMELIGPAINLNHWVLDTSLFHHVALVPATATRWSTAWTYGAIGLVAAAIGAAVFNRRDLAGKCRSSRPVSTADRNAGAALRGHALIVAQLPRRID